MVSLAVEDSLWSFDVASSTKCFIHDFKEKIEDSSDIHIQWCQELSIIFLQDKVSVESLQISCTDQISGEKIKQGTHCANTLHKFWSFQLRSELSLHAAQMLKHSVVQRILSARCANAEAFSCAANCISMLATVTGKQITSKSACTCKQLCQLISINTRSQRASWYT